MKIIILTLPFDKFKKCQLSNKTTMTKLIGYLVPWVPLALLSSGVIILENFASFQRSQFKDLSPHVTTVQEGKHS